MRDHHASIPVNTRYDFYCYQIVEPQRAGAAIGYLAGAPIAETVIDLFGRHFAFTGVARRKCDGSYDLDSLRPGEFIAEPGLIYQMECIKQIRQEIRQDHPPLWKKHFSLADVDKAMRRDHLSYEIDFIVLFWLGVASALDLVFLLQNSG